MYFAGKIVSLTVRINIFAATLITAYQYTIQSIVLHITLHTVLPLVVAPVFLTRCRYVGAATIFSIIPYKFVIV